ncbi:MAG: hypothetical protein RL094_424 [Candidatus Parcubacteria bacterium]|jgi:hypothetical protein
MNELKDTLYQLELSLVNQDNRSSAEKLNKLLADDFIEYGSSGLIYNKEITINSLTSAPSPTYKIYDFEIISLSETFAQTRFKTDRINLDGTRLTSLRSSIWKKTGNDWQMYFHQGTPVK